jgi:ribose 5-phosphate isomerase A
MLTPDEIKQKLGVYAAGLVSNDSIIGLGTGSTVYWLIRELGHRASQGLAVRIVPTSMNTRKLAIEAGIGIMELNEVSFLPMTIDGADEIDERMQLVKGGGGALLMEKMVAAASGQLIIIADESKYVKQLGGFPLPLAVIPAGWEHVRRKVLSLGSKTVSLRKKQGQVVVTDEGHYLLDCHFEKIVDVAEMNTRLHLIPGVVETGLFVDMATTLILGYGDGRIEKREK